MQITMETGKLNGRLQLANGYTLVLRSHLYNYNLYSGAISVHDHQLLEPLFYTSLQAMFKSFLDANYPCKSLSTSKLVFNVPYSLTFSYRFFLPQLSKVTNLPKFHYVGLFSPSSSFGLDFVILIG